MKVSDTRREIVYVVDDDASVRDALSVMLTLEGFQVFGFADGDSFLAAVRQRQPNCIILDVHMPGRSGLDVLKELHHRHCAVPLLIISGQGDIPMAVDAIKNGALDFIEKPFHAETLVTRIREAIAAARQKAQAQAGSRLAPHFPGRDLLTPREFQVLELIANGASSKEAGRCLGISPRTIEVHRARVMEKLGAKNTIDLVHIVLRSGGDRAGDHRE
jgi:two-component system, LuxR family, response regulator FixJ